MPEWWCNNNELVQYGVATGENKQWRIQFSPSVLKQKQKSAIKKNGYETLFRQSARSVRMVT